jgi:hypothetical protein
MSGIKEGMDQAIKIAEVNEELNIQTKLGNDPLLGKSDVELAKAAERFREGSKSIRWIIQDIDRKKYQKDTDV